MVRVLNFSFVNVNCDTCFIFTIQKFAHVKPILLLCSQERDTNHGEMQHRIRKIMEMHDEIQQTFSAKLGISPATLSSIFKGRTRPTSNLVEAIHKQYPDISVSWLMFGEGEMFANPNSVDKDSKSDTDVVDVKQGESNQMETHRIGSPEDVEADPKKTNLSTGISARASKRESASRTIDANGQVIPHLTSQMVEMLLAKNQDKRQRQITEIRIFFDDDTYEVFSGNNKKS